MNKETMLPMKLYFGIDLGGTDIKMGLFSGEGQIEAQATVCTKQEEGPESIVERIAAFVAQARKQAGTDSCVEAVGIGVPGILDTSGGQILESANLPQLNGFGIGAALRQATGLPVFLENDACMAALGEQWVGAGKGQHNLMMITLGSGVGGAVVINGQLFKVGDHSGEVGHLVVDPHGRACTCGRTGCLEAYMGKLGLIGLYCEKADAMELILPDRTSLSPLYMALRADEGEKAARDAFADAASMFGLALANITNLMGVTHFVLGGGVAGAWKWMERAAREAYQKIVFPHLAKELDICPAVLGEKAGMAGAASYAMNQLTPQLNH